MIERYSVGIDFGTLSARAILVDTHSGKEVFTSIYGYQDAVIDRSLPQSAEELPADYALQNPGRLHQRRQSAFEGYYEQCRGQPRRYYFHRHRFYGLHGAAGGQEL